MNEIQNLDLLNSTYACFQSSDGKKLEVSLSSPLESNIVCSWDKENILVFFKWDLLCLC